MSDEPELLDQIRSIAYGQTPLMVSESVQALAQAVLILYDDMLTELTALREKVAFLESAE